MNFLSRIGLIISIFSFCNGYIYSFSWIRGSILSKPTVKKHLSSTYLNLIDTQSSDVLEAITNPIVPISNEDSASNSSNIRQRKPFINEQRRSQFLETSVFLLRAAVVGVMTGGAGNCFAHFAYIFQLMQR